MDTFLIVFAAIGVIVVVLKAFRLWKSCKRKGFESEELRSLKKFLRIDSYPCDDNENEIFLNLVRREALRRGGKPKAQTEWEAINALVLGLWPVLKDLHDYMVKNCNRDRRDSLELLLNAGASILQTTSRR